MAVRPTEDVLAELLTYQRKLQGHLVCSPILPRGAPVMGRGGSAPIAISELQDTEIDDRGPERAHAADLNRTADLLIELGKSLARNQHRSVAWAERLSWAAAGAGLLLGVAGCGLPAALGLGFFWRWVLGG